DVAITVVYTLSLHDALPICFDVSTRINNGFSNSVKANPTLLNLYLERTFLKNDRGVIRLQGFDLMNQNTGISREVSGNEIYDVRSEEHTSELQSRENIVCRL